MARVSHLERSLARLRRMPDCRRARKVEMWNPFARRRQDLWGADIQALMDSYVLAVQVCGMDSRAQHVQAAQLSEEVGDWLRANCFYQVWSWRKIKVGNRKLWRVHITALYLDGLDPTPVPQILETNG